MSFLSSIKRFLSVAVLVSFSVVALEKNSLANDPVKVGVYVQDIQNLDLKTHTYAVDAYIWFIWKNVNLDPSESFEFMNSSDVWGHTKTKSFQKPERLPTGELYQVVRVQGRFSKKFNLSHYPFDRQLLTVEFEDSSLETDRGIQFVADQDAAVLNPDLVLPGFIVGKPRINITSAFYPTRFGDTRMREQGASYSRVALEVPVVRPVWTYTVKLMLPILCVIICAALMLLFSPSHIDARVGIGITALLTIVALQITLNEDLPEIDYLVLIDKIYLGAYLYVIAGLAIVVKTTWMLDKSLESVTRAVRLNRRSLLFLTIGYFIVVVALVLPAIR